MVVLSLGNGSFRVTSQVLCEGNPSNDRAFSGALDEHERLCHELQLVGGYRTKNRFTA